MISPPDSFSIRSGDPNYYPAWREIGKLLDVYLDGVAVTRVIAYDENEGFVRRLKTDADGRVMLDKGAGIAVEETLRGCVEARWLKSTLDA
jgi:hypothetical protein